MGRAGAVLQPYKARGRESGSGFALSWRLLQDQGGQTCCSAPGRSFGPVCPAPVRGRGCRARGTSISLSPTPAARHRAWESSVFPAMVSDTRDPQVESLPSSTLTPDRAGLSPPGFSFCRFPSFTHMLP